MKADNFHQAEMFNYLNRFKVKELANEMCKTDKHKQGPGQLDIDSGEQELSTTA